MENSGQGSSTPAVANPRRGREDLLRFRAAMDLSAEIILLNDRASLRFVDANDMASRALGYSRAELLAMGIADLVSESRETIEEVCDRVIAGDAVGYRVRADYRKKDGGTIPVEVTRRALRSGGGWIIVSVARDITEQLAVETALHASIERYDYAMHATNDVIWDWNLLTDQVVQNENANRVFGYPERDVTVKDWQERLHPEDRERVLQGIQATIRAGRENWSDEYRLRRRDGSYAHIFDRGHVVFGASGEAVRMIGAMADISARKEAEERATQQAQRHRLIAEFSRNALAASDIASIMEEAASLVTQALHTDYCALLELVENRRFLAWRVVRGWPATRLGRSAIDVIPGSHAAYLLASSEPVIVDDFRTEKRFAASSMLMHAVRSGIEVPIMGKQGNYGVLAVHTKDKRQFAQDEIDFMQAVCNILAVAIERKQSETRLAQLAQFDVLTGLPNRQLFNDRLALTLTQAARSGRPMATLFIDLDRFKLVNDTRGHAIGDQLLQRAAGRLTECIRGGDTVARLGGDEFAAILNDLTRPGDAAVVAQKIIDALEQPFLLDGQESQVTASVGIALHPADGADAGTLIRNADTAMYRAKEQGRNNYQYYTREMNERALQRVRMQHLLRGALGRGEFVLHYQPALSLATGVICGAEALLRWIHPDKGLIAPVEFISVLEEAGIIMAAGEWVLEEACRQIRVWEGDGLVVPPVSVNLSGQQFQHKDLGALVDRALSNNGVRASQLRFEVKEALLMQDPDGAGRILDTLKLSGVRLSLDNFGTGYSSLSRLKRLPLDALKVDRKFIRGIASDPDDAAITRAIIGLAHDLKLRVLAEGVETEQQLEFLHRNGCDEIQGYHFSRPVAPEEFAAMLRTGRRLALPAAPGGPRAAASG